MSIEILIVIVLVLTGRMYIWFKAKQTEKNIAPKSRQVSPGLREYQVNYHLFPNVLNKAKDALEFQTMPSLSSTEHDAQPHQSTQRP